MTHYLGGGCDEWTRLKGEASIGDDGEVLSVEIDYHEWSEPHDYGLTVAREHLSEYEVVDTYVDGSRWPMDAIIEHYGRKVATDALDEAIKAAEASR